MLTSPTLNGFISISLSLSRFPFDAVAFSFCSVFFRRSQTCAGARIKCDAPAMKEFSTHSPVKLCKHFINPTLVHMRNPARAHSPDISDSFRSFPSHLNRSTVNNAGKGVIATRTPTKANGEEVNPFLFPFDRLFRRLCSLIHYKIISMALIKPLGGPIIGRMQVQAQLEIRNL